MHSVYNAKGRQNWPPNMLHNGGGVTKVGRESAQVVKDRHHKKRLRQRMLDWASNTMVCAMGITVGKLDDEIAQDQYNLTHNDAEYVRHRSFRSSFPAGARG